MFRPRIDYADGAGSGDVRQQIPILINEARSQPDNPVPLLKLVHACAQLWIKTQQSDLLPRIIAYLEKAISLDTGAHSRPIRQLIDGVLRRCEALQLAEPAAKLKELIGRMETKEAAPLGAEPRWEKNRNKLLFALGLAAITCAYYLFRPHGFHAAPGIASLVQVLRHAVLLDYVPFIVLLFSLYTISGGISLRGDIPARPLTNTAFLALGAAGASFIGTTGMAMVLIRPLLQINSERRHVKHTVVFFIFLVCNIGGLLLPVGDPPLFLGYLRGVPFLWTLTLIAPWALSCALLLAVYFVWDTIAYRSEPKAAITVDEKIRKPIRIDGKRNLVLLLGVVLAVALLVPGRTLPGTSWVIPNIYLREIVQLALAAISLAITPKIARQVNQFNFTAIGEVACLFIGIFITMQAPVEILQIEGVKLGLTSPAQFFWASGLLSSVLDNAPTYVVYFETAGSLTGSHLQLMSGVQTLTGTIPISLLAAISCGSVFMGANTYIGNGPNFMVKSIAEQSGVRMPSFFGYMAYSAAILIPLFLLLTLVFFRG
ncbi:MAG TPA: sodium:proton antiporter [Tepidisphaeraceae bacterium]|nr:sodium:proton antiporter [Tepidisphaeraceae bacterium]